LAQKSQRSLAELNGGNALCRASHLHPSFMPDCFRGDAPPRARADCLQILFLIDAIYLLTRYIASSPQGVCWPNIRDAPEGKNQTADPSSP